MNTLTFLLLTLPITVVAQISAGESHVFTDKLGRKITAELQLVQSDQITIKRKDGRAFTISLDKLIEEDRAYAEKWKSQQTAEDAALSAKIAAANLAVERRQIIAAFCTKNFRQKVGNGECWTLANEAFKACGAKRPDKQLRVWGRLVDISNEPIEPGDVVEFRTARIPGYGTTGPEHTAVVVKGGRRGKCTLAEQNWGNVKKIRNIRVDLSKLESGKVMVYRHE